MANPPKKDKGVKQEMVGTPKVSTIRYWSEQEFV